jgi:hypothetical protein
MRPSARTRANRRNAGRSTGPRTPAGKLRVGKNALRHGLAIPLDRDSGLDEEVERLAHVIAGRGADPIRLERARRIAEAQIDVLRVRRARYALLADPRARVKQPSARQLIRAYKQLRRGRELDERGRPARLALGEANAQALPPSFEAGLDALAAQLARLDRYERRALSRRNSAIHDFGMAPANHGPGEEPHARVGEARGRGGPTRRADASCILLNRQRRGGHGNDHATRE